MFITDSKEEKEEANELSTKIKKFVKDKKELMLKQIEEFYESHP